MKGKKNFWLGVTVIARTDPDATFMRMKEDHMLNGQLKPGYNVQISLESQFIIHYSLHQTTNDIHTLKPHLKSYSYQYETLPEYLTADAGYGSEENYELLETIGYRSIRQVQHLRQGATDL